MVKNSLPCSLSLASDYLVVFKCAASDCTLLMSISVERLTKGKLTWIAHRSLWDLFLAPESLQERQNKVGEAQTLQHSGDPEPGPGHWDTKQTLRTAQPTITNIFTSNITTSESNNGQTLLNNVQIWTELGLERYLNVKNGASFHVISWLWLIICTLVNWRPLSHKVLQNYLIPIIDPMNKSNKRRKCLAGGEEALTDGTSVKFVRYKGNLDPRKLRKERTFLHIIVHFWWIYAFRKLKYVQ